MSTTAPAGTLLREWRTRRRISQMDLAHETGVSPRHLSFVETGRSRPSPELVLRLADHLDVPLRDQNSLLLAAGYAPRHAHTALDDVSMRRARRAMQHLLDSHDPYPGVVVDRLWDVTLANTAAGNLVAALPDHLTTPTVNVFRACLHPDGLIRHTINADEWATYLVGQLRRLTVLTADAEVRELTEEVTAYPAVTSLGTGRSLGPEVSGDPVPWIPWQLDLGGVELSFFTTITSFGTPQDVTLSELAVELFYPADDATETALRSRVGG